MSDSTTLVTTALTTPLLDLLQRGRGRAATQVI